MSQSTSGDDVLRAELERLRAENARLREQLGASHEQEGSAPDPAGPVMRIGEVVSSVAAQSAEAASVLQQGAGGLQLANLEVRLDCGATSIDDQLALDLAAPGAGSALLLRFAPAGRGAPASTVAEVPDVVGYTVALARRKLTDRRLSVVVSALPGAAGVVRSQRPGAGELTPEGTVVRLVVH